MCAQMVLVATVLNQGAERQNAPQFRPGHGLLSLFKTDVIPPVLGRIACGQPTRERK